MRPLVFDNTVLSHFARASKLQVLEHLVTGMTCVVPEQVSRELISGVTEHPALAQVIGLPWLQVVELADIAEVVAFARYKAEFGGGPERNSGEAAVLAWASTHGGIALIDERVATRAAQRDGIEVHGTMWLIANAIRNSLLERASAEAMVDDLAATDMRLPTDGAGFLAWAYENDLLP